MVKVVASYTFKVTFRDMEHFTRVTTWLNANVGHGRDHWTIPGKIRSALKYNDSVTKTVFIFKTDFNPEIALIAALM